MLQFTALIVLLLSFASSLVAQDLTIDQEAAYQRIVFEVLSPFCPGRALHDCPSGAASELKNEIRTMLGAGRTEEQIISDLYGRYGEDIRAVPELKGTGIPLWIGPLVFFALGAAALAFWLRSNRAKSS